MWGRQPSRGTPTYDFAKISQKLHEIERILTLRSGGGMRGGGAAKILLCRSATAMRETFTVSYIRQWTFYEISFPLLPPVNETAAR